MTRDSSRGRSLLRRIVGRCKDYMAALFLGMGILFMSTAFYLAAETQLTAITIIAGASGAVALALAVIMTRIQDNKDDAKFITQVKLAQDASASLLKEVQALRADIDKWMKASGR